MKEFDFDHVAICVSDIEKSVNFYAKNFNAETVYQDETWAMLQIGSGKLALTLPQQHPPHTAFSISDENMLPKDAEIKSHRDGSKYVYLDDPDGNTVEIIYFPS